LRCIRQQKIILKHLRQHFYTRF